MKLPWRIPPRLQQETFKDQAYELIRRAIIDGEFRSGEELVGSRLAERLGISRTPVREALQMLEHEGWVERLRTGTVRVTGLALDEVEELYATREVLEGLTARYAASRVTEEQIKRLKGISNEMTSATARKDHAGVESLGLIFHSIVHEASGFKFVSQQLIRMRYHVNRYRRLTISSPGRTLDAMEEHVEIIAALRRGDAVAAEDAMRRHIYNGWLVMKKAFSDRLAKHSGTG